MFGKSSRQARRSCVVAASRDAAAAVAVAGLVVAKWWAIVVRLPSGQALCEVVQPAPTPAARDLSAKRQDAGATDPLMEKTAALKIIYVGTCCNGGGGGWGRMCSGWVGGGFG